MTREIQKGFLSFRVSHFCLGIVVEVGVEALTNRPQNSDGASSELPQSGVEGVTQETAIRLKRGSWRESPFKGEGLSKISAGRIPTMNFSILE